MTTRQQIRCIEVVEIVSDYLERALSADECARLEEHLDGCEGCEAYVVQMRATVGALRGLGGAAFEVNVETLRAAFRARTANG